MRTMLIADEGKILTDGENYGSSVLLGEGKSTDEYSEITKEEYEKILAEMGAEGESQ